MFTTINQVREFTGYEVTKETIAISQGIIEAYIGRDEADIESATDRELLAKATAYQCAYMQGDESKVFEQVAATQVMQSGNMVSFTQNGTSPWVAPLAVLACKRLSWNRIRSIKTGSIFPTGPSEYRWEQE